MLKRLMCCVLIFLCFLCSVSAEEVHPDGFVFMDAIDWNTTADEAAAVLGDGVQRDSADEPGIGHLDILFVQEAEIAGYPVSGLMLVYFEDRLYSFECYFPQAAVQDVQALADALSSFLGEANHYEEDHYAFSDIISGDKTLYRWKRGSVTEASLVRMKEQDYGLNISNASVSAAINQAFEDAGYLDE